jgi:hypothetical protein
MRYLALKTAARAELLARLPAMIAEHDASHCAEIEAWMLERRQLRATGPG